MAYGFKYNSIRGWLGLGIGILGIFCIATGIGFVIGMPIVLAGIWIANY